MRLRVGFVSNSSSSSFVIIDKRKTTSDVAWEMVEIIEEDYLNNGNKHSKWYVDAISWLSEHEGFDGPIVIPWSCNYDTWISQIKSSRFHPDEGIFVDTCNNHDWHGKLDYILYGQHEDRHFDYKRDYPDMVFLDLSTLKFVKRSEFRPLWEREKWNED